MNEAFEIQSENEQQRWLDRLVDGELTHDQQRQLIVSLEAQPDGWRRCALAFLEAQTWVRELQHLTNGRPEAISPSVEKAKPLVSHRRNWLRPLAIAAGLVVAFTFGIAARGVLPTGSDDRQPLPANSNGQLIASTNPAEKQAISATEAQPLQQETLKVTIPSADGESEQTLELPLFEGDEEALASLLAEQKPVLSELERKTLESTGHHVEQRRAYYPVQLGDGRQAVLPMDLVEVQYTGGWQ